MARFPRGVDTMLGPIGLLMILLLAFVWQLFPEQLLRSTGFRWSKEWRVGMVAAMYILASVGAIDRMYRRRRCRAR